MKFVHLQVATAYDLLSSTAAIDNIIEKAKQFHYPAVAITDHNVMYGVIEFYQKCHAAGIKPLIGMTISIEGVTQPLETHELLLLAKTTQGYRNLLKISSAIETREETKLPIKWLESYKEGLLLFSPGMTGEVERLIGQGLHDDAHIVIAKWREIADDANFYMALQKENPQYEAIRSFCETEGIPAVATKNVQYLEPKGIRSTEILRAIRDNETVSWQNLPNAGGAYFASPEEMEALFTTPFEKEALALTGEIADMCDVEIAMDQHLLPKFPLAEGFEAGPVLKDLCYEALKKRVSNLSAVYWERLDYELNVIQDMGFSDYFLIVWDVMKYARESDILTGPGRGSAAGSLVSFVLQITDVDPIEYQLLFERFLNPERVSMPDIDLDFPDNRRDEVISYVVEKYGTQHVAQIGTFGTLAAKAAIRDTARTFGLNSVQLTDWSKLISRELGMTLTKAYEQSTALQRHIISSEQNQLIWEIANEIEGLPRHISTHAAGVVISDKPLVDQIALQKGSGDALLTQFAMGDLEKIGLLKMDFLGLRNLTLLDRTIKNVNYLRDTPLTIQDIPLDDAKTLQIFQKGDTTGIFQFESDGIRRVLKHLRPTSFEDIVATNALYRPGPMEQIDTFIARKHGKQEIVYPHPDLEPILGVTYGIIVYQEQIIQVASQMAGFSLGEADLLRRAVSKKKADVLEEERIHFVTGASQKGYTKESANQVYDLIVRFANYGFNRSHAVAYSKIAFQLAYLKANYPAAFMASLLSAVIGNDDKISQYMTEAKNYGIKMKGPSINRSYYHFQVEGDAIRFSLRVIRKVPSKFVMAIVNERKGAPFLDFFDFCERMPQKQLTKQVLEALIYAGCFDEFGKDRATYMASMDAALQYVHLLGDDEKGINLFTTDDELFSKMKPKYREASPLALDTKLEKEKEYVGQYVSAHPVTFYQDKLKLLEITALSQVKSGKNYKVAAYIHDIKSIRTKKGESMCFLTISDDSREMSAVMFPETYRKYADLAQKGLIVLLQAKVDQRNGELQLVINKAENVKDIEVPKRAFLRIKDVSKLEQLKTILLANRGDISVILHDETTKITTQLQPKFCINGSPETIKTITEFLGEGNFIIR
ncbi:DNA polymerase III subunit alpha [Listeria weihenstephanensis FSL R9-0317]|uniref:DNA polymerase III subunit alpha n=1 Tax=Listeria weihenstephanensis TaxID=1006155 RepID=A0A1S7FV30_9LIST|nr:DNA polymerase III subunit alpha [Listeria weihenstephanensis]AQY51306.1 DNA polymerase III DnaE [Listeria weihenstephanensis]EUJ36750.1 DNA polymerase III subunit alpha [Listeria weihenstephanensis FSL R9-0317]